MDLDDHLLPPLPLETGHDKLKLHLLEGTKLWRLTQNGKVMLISPNCCSLKKTNINCCLEFLKIKDLLLQAWQNSKHFTTKVQKHTISSYRLIQVFFTMKYFIISFDFLKSKGSKDLLEVQLSQNFLIFTPPKTQGAKSSPGSSHAEKVL